MVVFYLHACLPGFQFPIIMRCERSNTLPLWDARGRPHTHVNASAGDFLRIYSVPMLLTDGLGLLREIVVMAVNWIIMLPPNRDTRQDLCIGGISLVDFIYHFQIARISCLQVADSFWASLKAVILRGKTGTYAYIKTSTGITLSRRNSNAI